MEIKVNIEIHFALKIGERKVQRNRLKTNVKEKQTSSKSVTNVFQ